MKVLYFSRSYTPHDHRFLSTVSGAGHEVFHLRLEADPAQKEDRPVPPGVGLVRWAGEQGRFEWADIPRLAFALKRILHDLQPDLVHAGPVQTCAFLTTLASFRPLLTMSWGYDLVQDVHRGRWWEWVTRYTLRHSTYFISDARVTREKAVAFGMDPERTAVFPWGVDLEHFSPSLSVAARSDPFRLFCNRAWEPLYGVDVLTRAFARIAPERPDLSLTLLGGGSQAASLHQTLLGAGLLEQVYFGGQVSQSELPGWLRQTDLYISPSHVDGSSVSLMEAMACGLPALVSDIPGNREWVIEGENGWLFKDGDPEDLAVKIVLAMENRERLAEMGRHSRKIAEARADWKKNAAVLLQTYENALSANMDGRKAERSL
jgi:glycosyltransferase involved in cell wall biosynthesis